jgi:signal transduction histidine kinase
MPDQTTIIVDLQAALLSERLQEVTEALAATRRPEEVFRIILTPALSALGGIAGRVLLIQGDQLRVAAQQGHDQAVSIWQSGALSEHTPATTVVRTKQPLFFEYAGALTAAYPELEARTGGTAAVASAVLPMLEDGQCLGVIVLDFQAPHPFPPPEKRFLRTLAAQGALALDRARLSGDLAAQVQARTAELDAFARFTEAAGITADVLTLAARAVDMLAVMFPGCSGAYYALEGGLWKMRVHSPDMSANAALMDLAHAGLPHDTPIFAQPRKTGEATFVEGWNAVQEQFAQTEAYQGVATYPLRLGGEICAMFAIGLKQAAPWSESARAVFRSVGRSLDLALERTESARRLEEQNTELQARTRALEGFANLTRDLGLHSEADPLIEASLGLAMSLLPPGYAAFWETEGPLWQANVQVENVGNADLQAVIDAGLPVGQTPTLDTPVQTRQPLYQDVYPQGLETAPEVVRHVNAVATLPVLVRSEVRGVLNVALFETRFWNAADRAVLETTARSLGLALERAEQAWQLAEERAALAAFTAFTEAVGTQTDVVSLVQQAAALLQETQALDVGYYERSGDLFRIRLWTENFPAALLAHGQAGFRLDQPSLAAAARSHDTVFIDHWDAAAQAVHESSMYSSVAVQPFFQDQVMTSVMVVGSRSRPGWSERNKGVFRAIGHSLALALDRATQTRQLTAQRDTLEGRTQALLASNEELEAFTYSVSHDLRTPVRHIVSFMELLRRALPGSLGGRTERYLSVINDSAAQLNSLIDAMLDLSRTSRQPLRQEAVDLGKLVTAARAELASVLAGRQVEWRMGALPVVMGDAGLLRRVVSTLLHNAVKYSRTRERAVIEVWAEERPQEWAVFVRDNGVGFDPRYQDKLFIMFQRLHRQEDFEGVGVALANARRIITRHGGKMLAVGATDQGATFGFTLPQPGRAMMDSKAGPPASP